MAMPAPAGTDGMDQSAIRKMGEEIGTISIPRRMDHMKGLAGEVKGAAHKKCGM